MSPEIQEWSHKSRSRINNLYLLTPPIISDIRERCKIACRLSLWLSTDDLERTTALLLHYFSEFGSFGGQYVRVVKVTKIQSARCREKTSVFGNL